MGDYIFEVANRYFFAFKLVLPSKERNRAGSSRNEFDYSRRNTQTSFSLLDRRSCDNFGLAHFSMFMLEKKVDQTEPSF